MQNKQFKWDQFAGGMSEGSKRGYTGAFQDGYGLDFRSDPDVLSLTRALKKDSGSSVVDLILDTAEAPNGDVYFYGNTGHLYKRTSGGVYSQPKGAAITNSVGNGLAIFNNKLWYAYNTGIGKANLPASASTDFTDDYFVSADDDAEFYSGVFGMVNTYTLPQNTPNEGSTHRKSWTATGSPILGVVVRIAAKGTGDWTVIVHNASNNEITRTTLTNAALGAASSTTYFQFADAVQLTAGQTYHIHIVSTTTDGTVSVTTSNDLTTLGVAIIKVVSEDDVDQSNSTRNVLQPNINIYNLGTSVSEALVDRLPFVPTARNIIAVSLMILTIGTGDWKVILHNSLNQEIGTSTITNANLKERAVYMKFKFSSAIELTPGETYHLHLIRVGGSGGNVATTTNNNFSTAGYRTHFQILDNNAYHPMLEYSNLLLIGNGNKVATIDDTELYDPEALTLPVGETIVKFETIGDYVSIITRRGSNIADYGSSRIYYWDGRSPFINAFVDVDGQVNTVKNDSNKLLIVHGTQVRLSYYTGAITPMRRLKYLQNTLTAEVLPNAIDVYEGILLFGVSNVSNSAVPAGVYSYGRKDKDYPIALNYDNKISTGNNGTTVTIGLIKALSAGKLFVSWKDGSNYGVDIIDSIDVSSGYITSLKFTDQAPNIEKLAVSASVSCAALTDGQSIVVEYRTERSNGWKTLFTVNTVGAAYMSNPFSQADNPRFYEIEFKVTLNKGTAADAPTLKSLMFFFQKEEEYQFKQLVV